MTSIPSHRLPIPFRFVSASHALDVADRDGKEGIGMRKLFVATTTVAIFALLVMPGSPAMARVAARAMAVRPPRPRASRSRATASTASVAKLGSRRRPSVLLAGSTRWLRCSATNSDGDGIEVWPSEDDLVYMQLDHPTSSSCSVAVRRSGRRTVALQTAGRRCTRTVTRGQRDDPRARVRRVPRGGLS